MVAVLISLLVAGWAVAPARVRRLRSALTAAEERRRRRRAAAAVPAVCLGVARRLVVGEGLVTALEGASRGTRLESDLGRVLEEHARGLTLGRATERWVGRDDGFEIGLLVASVRLSATALGARPELFDQVALVLRRRTELRAEALAQAAQARVSMWVVAALPWVVALGVVAEGGEPARVLLADRVGWLCIAGAVALEATGVAWMRSMVARAVR